MASPPTRRTPLYDEATGQRFRTVREAAAASFRHKNTIHRRIEYIEGMRIIRRDEVAVAGSNTEHMRRRLRKLYPLAYPENNTSC